MCCSIGKCCGYFILLVQRVTVVKETVPWYILGSDGKRVEIDNILNTLRKTCLFNKPVLVFIQACAGGNILLHYITVSLMFYFIYFIWRMYGET